MNLADLMADLTATRKPPTDAEADFIARHGSLTDVGIALGNCCGIHPVLRPRYLELYAQSRRAA